MKIIEIEILKEKENLKKLLKLENKLEKIKDFNIIKRISLNL
jgi:hypothetical protein